MKNRDKQQILKSETLEAEHICVFFHCVLFEK